MRAIVVTNGILENPTPWQKELQNADLVIAADGGARHARALGLVPTAVVGDADSLDEETAAWLQEKGVPLLRHPRAKDETDLELALLYAVKRGAQEIAVLAAMGGRIDQTIANVELLVHPALAGRRVRLLGSNYEAQLVRGGEECVVSGAAGDTVSLLPLSGEARGVSTSGLRWVLDGATLLFGPARGVSNEMTGPAARVRLEAGVDSWRHLGLATHAAQTLLEAVLGFLLAVVTGLVLALAVDLSSLLRRTIYPLLVISQTIPVIALAPLLVLWLGYDIMPKILVVALVCFFPIVVSTADGLRSADPDWIALLRSMGASRWQVLTKVSLPSALPSFFSGLKVGITYSVIGAVIGEWVGGSVGLAFFMRRAHSSFRYDREFAGIAVTALLSIALFGIVAGMERVALPWYLARRER